MRAVNKVSLYYDDWKALNESSGSAELQRRCPPRGNCRAAICQCRALLSIYLSAAPGGGFKLLVLPRVSEVATGGPEVLLWRTEQGGGLLQQQKSGICLGYGQQICCPGIMKQCKTCERSVLPWVVWSLSSGCPQLGHRGWWRSPLLLPPFLTPVPLCAGFIPGTTAARLSPPRWVLGDLIH